MQTSYEVHFWKDATDKTFRVYVRAGDAESAIKEAYHVMNKYYNTVIRAIHSVVISDN